MGNNPLHEDIIARFPDMPPQLQAAARFVLDNPRDVALLSMRDQARLAGIAPATMTRLAKFLGMSGYDELRALFHDAIRAEDNSFAERARQQIQNQALEGDVALASRMFAKLADQIEGLSRLEVLQSVAQAADMLAGARRIYGLGRRSCHPVLWQFNYMISLLGERAILLDAPGGTGTDGLAHAQPGDVLFVMTINPYARETLEICEYAHARGLKIVAITDSEVAPVREIVDVAIIVPTDSLTFFHVVTPGFALAEVLASMLAGRAEMNAPEVLGETDTHLRRLDTYVAPSRRRRD
ncbi:MurR/RpiR family transcriptional regulator [Martelella sp. HB161492]|uniref:MurR/RpiR family transcriptional regulator n=1 Tax=Martelella sp. HB161492 TaxID=2720726 RepID=UPI0015929FB3|nr:MurR/RpiR family transcriptional regulator [Martelella sp. HB161492]